MQTLIMRFFLLAFLAAATTSPGINFDDLDAVEIADGTDIRYVIENMIDSVTPPLEETLPDASAESESSHGRCSKCVEKHSKKIVEHVLGKIKHICEHTSPSGTHTIPCPVARLCSLFKRRPEVALGVVIEHVRPVRLAFMLCRGKQACHHKHHSVAMDLSKGHSVGEVFLGDFDATDWESDLVRALEATEALPAWESDREEASEALPASVPEASQKTVDGPEMMCSRHGHHVHTRVGKCIQHVSKKVMKHVVLKVFEKCMDANGRREKMCSWMFAHYKIASGMLLGKVEPFKFALGFCMSQEKKHHHHHGKHDHHGETVVGEGLDEVSESASAIHTKNDLYFPMNVLSLFIPGMSDSTKAPRLKR
jgi:hypothetical protein